MLRPLGVLARVAMIVLPLLAMAVGLIYLRLIYDPDKPISVRFLADPIERGLNAELPGFAFDIGDAVIQRSQSGGIEFRLKDVRMSDGRGNAVAIAKFASVAVNPRALWSLRIAPSRIDLIEPRFLVSVDDKGQLAFRVPEAAATVRAGRPPQTPQTPRDGAAPLVAPPPGEVQRIEVARIIADALARVRRDGQTASYLEDIGLRNAVVILDQAGRQTVWRIPELDVDLQHKQKRSIVLARARIAGEGEPWTLKLRAEESEKARAIAVEIEFDGLVPRSLAQQVPQLALLETIDAPASGRITLDLTLDGSVSGAQAVTRFGAGALQVPAIGRGQIALERGAIELRYNGEANSFELLPTSQIQLGVGQVTLRGQAVPIDAGSPDKRWRYELHSVSGELRSVKAGQAAIPIQAFEMRGRYDHEAGGGIFERLALKAGGVDLEMVAPANLAADANVLEGRISPAPLATVLALWPDELAPRTRAWVVGSVRKGQLRGGSFRLGRAAGGGGDRHLSLSLEAGDVELEVAKGLPPLEMPRALLRVEDTSLEVSVPDAAMTVAPGRRLTAKGGRFTAIDIGGAQPRGEIAARVQGPLVAALELADREPWRLTRGLAVALSAIDGKLDGTVKATLPLGDDLSLADVRFETKTRITDGRIKGAFGAHDISGATVSIDGTEKSLEIKGDMVLAGVNARLLGRWAPGSADLKTPIAKLALRLDDADRNQLGLDLERMVRGDVPIEILVLRTGAEPAMKLQVNADLTPAELDLEEIAWRKPAGRPARLAFDLGKPQSGKGVELQNFKLDGENIAIDGWVAIGPDNRVREFLFPEFLINVVSSLEVQGTMRADKSERVWDVKVRGKSPFDAGDVLRAMMSPTTSPAKPPTKQRPGLDLSVDMDSVLGLNDTRLRQMRLKLQKRNELVTVVDFRSMLDGNRPLVAVLKPEPGRPRTLRLETADAGQALKLAGIYQNMVGGNGTLTLNLDGRGAAEKQGQVTVTNFKVLGDAVASEVFQAPDDSRPLIAQQPRPGTRRVLREQFDFEELFAQFSFGNGQLVIDNALARGPLVGASVRGKVDFRSRRLDLGGTYVPLSGLSRAFSEIPLLGLILTGPNGEGVLGITYLIKGPMADPQVTVNPFSPLTPGLLREFMQMAPENSTITPQVDPKKAPPSPRVGPQIRASPPAAAQPGASVLPRTPEVLDGWAATPKQAPSKKRQASP